MILIGKQDNIIVIYEETCYTLVCTECIKQKLNPYNNY